ncbi:MAG: biotin/lipoyl-binding protein [Rubritepida sp.]|nr:biotin/lipoyl-binding protein [Rubritepida sp.]
MVPVAVLVQDVPVTVFGLGAIEARVLSRVGFEVPGTLVEVTADDGDRVAVGAVLARLNPASQEARVARADAAVLSAAAAAARAKAQRERAEAQFTQRLATARRRRGLARGGVGSQEIDDAESLYPGPYTEHPSPAAHSRTIRRRCLKPAASPRTSLARVVMAASKSIAPAARSHGAVTAGAGRLEGGADDNAVTRQGAAQGNLGTPQGRRVLGNDQGRPIIESGHLPSGSR